MNAAVRYLGDRDQNSELDRNSELADLVPFIEDSIPISDSVEEQVYLVVIDLVPAP